jgi:hypothetical protein
MENNNLPSNNSLLDAEHKDSNFFTENIEINTKSKVEENIINCRIDIHEKLQPPPISMYIKNDNEEIAMFTKGNFSIVTGPPKARKTFLLSMLMASSIKGQFSIFKCATKGVNIFFDTEQSKYKTQYITKRICNLSESFNTDNFQVYSLRTLDPFERLELIEKVLSETENINFVAIDGIIDLDTDVISNIEQAQNIVSKLMLWTEKYNIHIVGVLHFNKTSNTPTGHLGTFALRKADAIIQVTKSKNNENITIVEVVEAREKAFKPFAFSVDEKGLPYILEDFVIEKSAKAIKEKVEKKQKPTPVKVEENIHFAIIEDLFRHKTDYSYTDLYKLIKIKVEEKIAFIGDNIAKDYIAFYVMKGFILKVNASKGKVIYTNNIQPQLEL